MSHLAKEVSLYVIDWAHKHRSEITNLRLQKLLYFIQGENVRINHSRLIKEDFYSWRLGPVIPSVYDEYCVYSSFVIPQSVAKFMPKNFSKSEIYAMELALRKYNRYTTWELVDISCSQDPWKYSFQIFGDKALIPYKIMEEYFEERF